MVLPARPETPLFDDSGFFIVRHRGQNLNPNSLLRFLGNASNKTTEQDGPADRKNVR